jgi:hypothetical protein
MRVKAKFRCNSITDNGHNLSINMTAIYGSEGENKDFTKVTPSGQLNISIDKDAPAAKLFEPLKDYYLHFEKAGE